MNTSTSSARSFLLGLFGLITIGYGLYWAASQMLAQLAEITSDLGKAIVAAAATVLIAVISLVFGKIWEQRVKLKDDVRQRKLPVYEAHVRFMFRILMSSKAENSAIPPDEIAEGFRAFTGQVLVWGAPEVIKKWTEFRLHDWEHGTPVDGFLKFESFVKALRADLGNSNNLLVDGDLVKLFVNDFDAHRATSTHAAAGLATASGSSTREAVNVQDEP